MADSVCKWYTRPELNEYRKDVFDPHECSKCLELGNNLQLALSELSSLQLINKLLFKELEETTAKLEVLCCVAVNVKSDQSQNSWLTTECKRYRNNGKNNIAKCIYTPHFPVATNNRYDVLLNLTDHPSGREDVASEMQGIKSVNEKLKIRSDKKNAQTRNYIKHRIGAPNKVNNQYRYEPVNI
jgi:hypothetical protein